MNNKKTILEKENFKIEIIKEKLESNQSTNQLQNWCKLFECLSKDRKQGEKNKRIGNRNSKYMFRELNN